MGSFVFLIPAMNHVLEKGENNRAKQKDKRQTTQARHVRFNCWSLSLPRAVYFIGTTSTIEFGREVAIGSPFTSRCVLLRTPIVV